MFALKGAINGLNGCGEGVLWRGETSLRSDTKEVAKSQ